MCEKSSTWYEEERSRILYTCEEKYDGNMVAFVIDLEKQIANLKLEQDMMINCGVVKCLVCKHGDLDEDEEPCRDCHRTNGYKGFVFRGISDQKGSDQA